jgi:hypothetical protein
MVIEGSSAWRMPRTLAPGFSLEDGAPVARHAWSNIWQPLAKAAGLPPRTGLHALRHFYASLLIRHGEDAKTVQRLGHSSVAFTWDHQTRDAIRRALGSTPGDDADHLRDRGRLIVTYWQLRAGETRSYDKRMYIAGVWRARCPPARRCQGSVRPD